MDLFLQSLNSNNNRKTGPNSYNQTQRPTSNIHQRPPPPPFQNTAYTPQNRPPQTRPPPPPPVIPQTPAYRGRGRHNEHSFGHQPYQQNRQFVSNQRNNQYQRVYGGRDNFANQNRGFVQDAYSYNDQQYQRGRQDHFDQRQARQIQGFNRNPHRSDERGHYQRRQPTFNNYQTRQQSPNYQTRQQSPNYQTRQQSPNYPPNQNYQRQNYRRNQEPVDNFQARQRPKNYQQQAPRQRQVQRNQNRDRDNFRGRGGRNAERGRGGQRGRPRGRGRSFPQKNIPTKKDQNLSNQSQSASQKQSSIEVQSENQVSNEVSEEQQRSQEVSQSQQQEQLSEEEQQSQSVAQSESYQEQEYQNGNRSPSQNEEEDMQRIDVMCSRQEFDERLQTFRMNNRGRDAGLRLDTGRSFAIFEINKRTNEPDINLALKRFRRSTNRAEDQAEKDQTADCPRSRKGLTLTLKHILKQIIDSDGMRARDLAFPMPPSEQKIEFLHIYDFLWNRMRQMIKDVSRLQIKDRDTQQVITICEQMLRFFIIAVKQGRQPHTCKLQFDPKMNIESITKILTQLLQIYENNHYALSKDPNSNSYISPHQPEITSYAILISHDLQNTLYQKLRLRVNGFGIGHPLLNCRQVSKALQIKKALKLRDYQSFYRILQSRQIDYTQACLLIHHLPTIRRQTLRVLQKAGEIQSLTKNRRIPLSSLRRNLRFSKNLNKEFKEFIDHIEVRLVQDSNQTYVILNQFNQSLEDHISSYAFDFPQNKKDRKFYPNSPRKTSMIDSSQISREQLIKRLWYEGNYIDQCNSYYKRDSVLPLKKPETKVVTEVPVEISSPLLQEIKQKKPIVIEPKQQRQQIKQDNKNLNFLLQKKKEFNRSKFIKSLQGLIQNLIKKSDVHSQHQKKRGLQMAFEFIEILQLCILNKAFYRLKQFIDRQKIVIQTLDNLKQLQIKKNSFMSFFYRGNSQFSTFSSGFMCGLSSKVDYASKQSKNIIIQLQEITAKNTVPRKQMKVLVFFTSSPQTPLSQTHTKFMKNLASFIAEFPLNTKFISLIGDLCELNAPSQRIDVIRKINNRDQTISLKICFHHYRTEKNEPAFFCGFDTIIFVDLHNDSKSFKKIIEDFVQKRKQTMKTILGAIPQLQTCFLHLLVTKLDKMKLKNSPLSFNQLQIESCTSLLQEESLKLSSVLRQSILRTLSQSLLKRQVKMPVFEALPFTSLINQIQQNLTYAQSLCNQPFSLDLFEKYFKANIKCIGDAIKKMAGFYDSYDWKQILLEAAYFKSPEISSKLRVSQNQNYHSEQKVDLHELLSKKLQVAHYITRLLQETNFKVRFQKKKKERPYATNCQALAAAIQEYIGTLAMQDRPESLQMICEFIAENSCSLQFRQNSISGNSKQLITYILVQLQKELVFANILLPNDFKFRIRKDILVPKQPRRTLKQQKLMQEKPSQQKQAVKPIPPITLPKLQYKHQKLLDEMMKELEEQNYDANLRMNPVKSVKI